MRKIIFVFFLFAAYPSFSQVLNPDFESWTYGLDSFGYSTYIPTDTFSYLKLDHWTSSNSLTGNPASGGKFLVNQSTDSYSGLYAVKMNTDSIYIAGTLDRGLITPGFIVNGNFQFDLTTILIGSGGAVDPAQLAGAGSPISQRIDKIGLHVKYTPIPGDSMLVWAVLKSAGNKIAESKLYYSQASSVYQYIEGTFNYFSCDVPDTIVALIASSNPDFSTLLSGNSGLTPGSVLLVDSLSLVPFTVGSSRPLSQNFTTYTFENHSKEVTLSATGSDCTGGLLTFSLIGSPMHGSASLSGDTLLYTPATGFAGLDTMYYSASNGTYSSTGLVVISVFINSGVAEQAESTVAIYPNPAKDILMMMDPSLAQGPVFIYDVLGQKVSEYQLADGAKSIDISRLPSGAYIMEVRSISENKFLKFVKE